MTTRTRPRTIEKEPAFVSQQVADARRYYLELKPSAKAQCEVVCGGCERAEPDYLVARETFPFMAVEFVAEGEGTLKLRGREYRLQPGVAFAYAPKIPHEIRNDPRRPMRKYYVDFAGAAAARMLAANPLGEWSPVQVSRPHEVIELFEMLHREATEVAPGSRELCNQILPLLLLKIAQRKVPFGPAEPRSLAAYERVRRYMEQHFLRIRTIEEVASACHVTPMYLSRLFRRFAQTGAYQFLLRLKMNHAAELLLDRGMLVKQAAAELEFADAFHFSRVFKRVYGVPPERFIRQSREHRRA